ncbi:unnamed protein product [Cylicocyclus nassatus]|uniref:Uncharacterized protein n=1 Tax=Cylicocyclus nassatus TaxID=53992 RepID=A0AA36GE96_CYLNA|nr:unnamed protein product [Cylicocyclus nassatus]
MVRNSDKKRKVSKFNARNETSVAVVLFHTSGLKNSKIDDMRFSWLFARVTSWWFLRSAKAVIALPDFALTSRELLNCFKDTGFKYLFCPVKRKYLDLIIYITAIGGVKGADNTFVGLFYTNSVFCHLCYYQTNRVPPNFIVEPPRLCRNSELKRGDFYDCIDPPRKYLTVPAFAAVQVPK